MRLTTIDKYIQEYLSKQDLSTTAKHILIACLPKTGSRYLMRTLALLPDFQEVHLVPGYGRREQELSILKLMSVNDINYITKLHIRYSKVTAFLMEKFSVRPIFLTRNIFDIVVSLRDHLRQVGHIGPLIYVPDEILKADDDALDAFIADMIIPWYFNTYLSWSHCEDKLVVTYEELNKDISSVMKKIVTYYSLAAQDQDIENAILSANSSETGKNKAIMGRGEEISKSVKERIIHLSQYYKSYDLSFLGLTNER